MKKHSPYTPPIAAAALPFAALVVFAFFSHQGYLPDILSNDTARQDRQMPDDFRAPVNPFLEDEEVVRVTHTENGSVTEELLPVDHVLFEYVQVIDGCDIHFEGECLNVREGPGTDYPVVTQLRDNVVLKVDGLVKRDGELWYKIAFDEQLRYPERVTTDWFVAAPYVEILLDEGDQFFEHSATTTATSSKKIVVDRSDQTLYAYEDDGTLFTELIVSTGLELTPTPRGIFTIFRKTPSRYMQGPIPGIANDYYDMPGVPWNLYFTKEGAVLHGAYWHESFGTPYSHGCVNLAPKDAHTLYTWAELGTTVIVQD